MWVWRDGSGRIDSVTGSINRDTLEWLLAEDKWRGVKQQPESPVELSSDIPDEVVAVPRHYDSKAEWVKYAEARGADRDEVEDLTKSELIELYGG